MWPPLHLPPWLSFAAPVAVMRQEAGGRGGIGGSAIRGAGKYRASEQCGHAGPGMATARRCPGTVL